MKYTDNNFISKTVSAVKQYVQPKDSGVQYRTFFEKIHLDLPLLIGLVVLISFGFVILYSATNEQSVLMIRQLAHFGIAIFLMLFFSQIPPHIYKRWSLWLYAVGLFLLILVLAVGRIGMGAQRWLNLGLMQFQPSEMMKLTIPLFIAWYFSNKELPPKFPDLVIITAVVLIPLVLTLKQPDLGTAIILGISGAGALLFAGIRWRYVVAALAGILAAFPIFWHFMHDYQKQRVLTFLNPSGDPLGAGYHIIQSKIAIGSGGLFGKGWMTGTQSHLHFLPAHATDFIFAVCGEEFGFIGCAFLLFVYLYIIGRCFYIMINAQDTYTRILAGTLTFTFFMSVFINIGMVSGMLPVVGVPLPLISYGGSSMMTIMAGFGILMSIHWHKSLIDR